MKDWKQELKEREQRQRREMEMLRALHVAIDGKQGFPVQEIVGLVAKLPETDTTKYLKKNVCEFGVVYSRLDFLLRRFQSGLARLLQHFHSPEFFVLRFRKWIRIRRFIAQSFHIPLRVLLQTQSKHEELQKIGDLLRKKGLSEVQQLVNRLDQIQALMEQLLESPQFQAAAEAVKDRKAALTEKRYALATKHAIVAQEGENIRLARKAEQEAFERAKIKELQNLPTHFFIQTFHHHLEEMRDQGFQSEHRQELENLFILFEEALLATGVVNIIRRHLIPDYADSVDKREAMLDLWDDKENRLSNNDQLSKKQKRRRRRYYTDFMERDIDELYEYDEPDESSTGGT